MATLREQNIAEIIAGIEEENAWFEQEAMSWAEADYEAIPEEIRTPHCDRAAMVFIQSRYEEYVKLRIVVDYGSIEIITRRRKRRVRPITILHENSLPDGIFEEALANIFSKLIRDGSINY